jgi:putative membrane protein
VRPLLVLLTLPVTVVTLGLFMFVINALMFWTAASLVSGLNVNGFWAALMGSLIYSLLQLAIEFVLERLLPNK